MKFGPGHRVDIPGVIRSPALPSPHPPISRLQREEIRKSDRATSIKKTDVDAGLFEAVYFLLLIIITVTLKLTGFIG